jgi:hypothetical protein
MNPLDLAPTDRLSTTQVTLSYTAQGILFNNTPSLIVRNRLFAKLRTKENGTGISTIYYMRPSLTISVWKNTRIG